MSYYDNVLDWYRFSDCATFEDAKRKFPDKSPMFLRKIIYLKRIKISKDGTLIGAKRERTGASYPSHSSYAKKTKKRHVREAKSRETFGNSPKKNRCIECGSTELVQIEEISALMCSSCGYVGRPEN